MLRCRRRQPRCLEVAEDGDKVLKVLNNLTTEQANNLKEARVKSIIINKERV